MLSICMIVKNEKDVIERCIESVMNYLGEVVDEIIVVDTGSTDGTRDIVEKMGCKVYDFKWCDDFSKARNFSLEQSKNDWIMFIDADEFIYKANVDCLKNFCVENHITDYGTVGIENDGVENGGLFIGDLLPRVFNKKSYTFKNKIHESIYPKKEFDYEEINLDVYIKHTGYSREVLVNKNKVERNIALIKKELEQGENLYLVMHLGHNYFNSKEYTKAIEYYEQVVFNEKCTNTNYYLETVISYMKCLLILRQANVAIMCENLWSYCSYDDEFVYYLGMIYVENELYEKACDCFLNCVNREKTKIPKFKSYFILAEILNVCGLYEESLTYYEACIGHKDVSDKIIEISDKIQRNMGN